MKLLTVRWLVGLVAFGTVGYLAGHTGESGIELALAGIACVIMIPSPLEVKRSLQ